MLAPHWWHRFADAPTSVPHAGHSRGRICFGSDLKLGQAGCASGPVCSAIVREAARRLLAGKLPHAYNSRNRARTVSTGTLAGAGFASATGKKRA